MRIVVISHTAHYRSNGSVVGWGPTVRELDHLASLFDELVHVAPVHSGEAPASTLPYRAVNVRFVPVPPSGGDSLVKKMGVVRALGGYVQTIWRELDGADIVHVRCPANIGLAALLVLAVRSRPTVRWVKYAGNWGPGSHESFSYRVQRWLLRRGIARALVTVNGDWPKQPRYVHAFLNPCMTAQELKEAAAAAESKTLHSPVILLFVGRLTEEKGAGRALHILERLRSHGLEARLEIVGNGPDRVCVESSVVKLGLSDSVRFWGWLPREKVPDAYRRAHFLLLPSESEGWPKVLGEGMAYGAVPIASSVGGIPQILTKTGAGRVAPAYDCEAFASAIEEYVRQPNMWKRESSKATVGALAFSYDSYLDAVRTLLKLGSE